MINSKSCAPHERRRDLSLFFEVPSAVSVPFLTRELDPRIESLRRKGRLASWSLSPIVSKESALGYQLSLSVVAEQGSELEPLILRQLRPALHRYHGRWCDGKAAPLGSAADRLGGPEGVRIYSDFLVLTTRMTLDLMKTLPPNGRGQELQKTALTCIFFLFEHLGISPAERVYWLRTSIRSLAQMKPDPELWMRTFDGHARETYEKSAALRRFLAELAAGGWGPLGRDLEKHEGPLKDIARRLLAIESQLKKEWPRCFLISRPYVHRVLSLLGVENKLESSLFLLASYGLGYGIKSRGAQ